MGLRQRLSWLVGILAAEAILLSAMGRFRTAGASSLGRFLIAAALFFLIFSYRRVRASLRSSSSPAPLAALRFSWAWLAVHLCGLSFFVGLSFSTRFEFVWRSPAWFLFGIAAIAVVTFAFFPPSLVWTVLRIASYSSLYALAGGAAAWWSTGYSWHFWNSQRGQGLTGLTFDFVHLLLRIPFHNVVADRAQSVIGTSRFSVEVGAQCSGFEGLGMVLVFTILWLWFFRREIHFPQGLLLVPCGLVLMWVLNALRIAALIAIGHFGAPAIAIGGFHSEAGWISFAGVTFAYAAILQRFRWFAVTSSPPHTTESPATAAAAAGTETERNPAKIFLLPFFVILAASLVTHAASAGFEWLYPLRFLAALAALWFLRRHYTTLDWSLSWAGPAIGLAVFVLWLALERVISPAASAAGVAMPVALAAASPSLRLAWIAIRALAAVTTVPIAEELAFRGFLLRRLIAADFEAVPLGRMTWFALLGSSFAFGLLHGSRWIAGTLAGILFAFALTPKGKLADAIIAHAVANALLAAYVLAFGQWQLW